MTDFERQYEAERRGIDLLMALWNVKESDRRVTFDIVCAEISRRLNDVPAAILARNQETTED